MLSPNATLDASEVFGFSFSGSQCASDPVKCAVVLCRATDVCGKKCFDKFHRPRKLGSELLLHVVIVLMRIDRQLFHWERFKL